MSNIDDRIKELFTLFKLPTLATECVRRFRDALSVSRAIASLAHKRRYRAPVLDLIKLAGRAESVATGGQSYSEHPTGTPESGGSERPSRRNDYSGA